MTVQTTTTLRVTLVTGKDCHFCAQAREIFSRLQAVYPLVIGEVDLLSPEGQELGRRHGIYFPPGIFIDGRFVGFGRPSERKLRKLLDSLQQSASGAR